MGFVSACECTFWGSVCEKCPPGCPNNCPIFRNFAAEAQAIRGFFQPLLQKSQ